MGYFLQRPSRYLQITLRMAIGTLGSPQSLGTCLLHQCLPRPQFTLLCEGTVYPGSQNAGRALGQESWHLPNCFARPLPTASCAGGPAGTWLLDAPAQVPPTRPPEFFLRPDSSPQAPRWPLALVTVGPSPFQLPSLPGTLLPNILCGNHACWPHLVLLATAKFPLLALMPLPLMEPS